MEVARGFWRTLWRDLPLANFAFYALAVAHAEVVSLDPPWPELFFTAAFPMAVPLVVYALRWPHASRAEKAVALVLVPGTLLLLVLTFLFATPRPIDSHTLRTIFEIVVLANGVLIGVHAWRRGRTLFWLFFGPAAAYGALLENGGIALGYFHEIHYTLYLGPLPAPLATMVGWITVFYLSTWVVWELRALIPFLRGAALLSAALVAVAALLLDLQVDPLGTAVGFWHWNEQLDKGPLGVPILNFVAWICAILPFAYALFVRQRRFGVGPLDLGAGGHLRWLWVRVPLVLGVAAALFLATMVIVEGGTDGPTFTILRTTLLRWGLFRIGVADTACL